MSDSGKAVFLSYASQDAAAARRICEALRAAGIEVWFDQSELRGGDAWDQKIRRQIKECTLFLPVISASTQARREGYFRLEWKLAEDRTHLMAKGTPFLVPVCIDDTKDWNALVPDSFMTVQWTRLPEGETTPQFVERVGQLLTGDTSPPMPAQRSAPGGGRDASPRRPSSDASESSGRLGETSLPVKPARGVPAAAWIGLAAALTLGIGGFIVLRPTPNAGAGTRPPTAAAPAWPRDPELRRALVLLNGTEANTEDFALAEDIVKKALARNSTDPEAVTLMARVQVSYLFRGFDRGDERRATARRYAERAVQLAPNDPEALAALGVFNFQRGGDTELARELLNKAIALRPDEPYYYRHRDNALFFDPRVPVAEAITAAEKTAERFPRDALSQYELARHYRDLGRIEDCERAIDRTLAIEPIANAIGWKARIALNVRGDFAEMKALLDRVPPRMRSLERVVISRWIYAMAGTDREDGFEALQGLTSSWIEDFYYVGPKSLLLAALLEAAGKRESARLHFQAALAETRERQARDPANMALRRVETCALLGLGRSDEARAANRVVMESVRRPYRYDPFDLWWFSAIPRSLLLGDRETALALLREAAGGEASTPSGRTPVAESRLSGRAAVRMAMRQDARMAPFRDDPEIAALLAEPKKETGSAPAPGPANVPLSEAAQLAARAKALYTKLNYTRDDLATAEELARRATEKEPDHAAAWGVRAGVQATYLYRNWDRGEKRRQDVQAFANRALGLNPEEPEALLALGHLLRQQGLVEQSLVLFRRALAAAPSDNRMARAVGTTISFSGQREAGREVLLAAVKRDPRDPILRYDLALTYDLFVSQGGATADIKTAIEHLDAGLAVQPMASLLIAKAVVLGGWIGDLPAMRAALSQLEKLPLVEQAEDRAVFIAMWGALLAQDPARAAAAAALTAKNYFEDTVVPRRPKDWSLAIAHRVEKKENLARLDWQRAESVLRARLRDDPNNQMLLIELATTLAWLGRKEEALREIAPVEAAAREELNRPRSRALADFYAALGDAARAAPYLRQAIDRSVFLTAQTVPVDPWFDLLRGQPEFEALLKPKAP